MPVLPRWRDEIGEPVEELIRRELDNAIGPFRGRDPATDALMRKRGFAPAE